MLTMPTGRARSDADLAWETELLQHLDREGLTVPVQIPTR
jgi:Ser/Thr protein kinase RdoA (MazF antagonist)